jgi:hypothetical protein
MASLQSRISDLITAIGTDVKNLKQQTSVASSGTPTPTGFALSNVYTVTALAVTGAFAAPSGTPVEGNKLIIRIKDNGTTKTISWNAIYRTLDSTNLPLSTSTTAGKWMYFGFMYNATDSKWDLISRIVQA